MQELTLSEADRGRAYTLPPGTPLVLSLAENPTTGFRWQLPALGPVLRLEGDDYQAATPGVIGGGGRRILRIVAQSPGRETPVLKLRRPWESESQAVGEFRVTITVAAEASSPPPK